MGWRWRRPPLFVSDSVAPNAIRGDAVKVHSGANADCGCFADVQPLEPWYL